MPNAIPDEFEGLSPLNTLDFLKLLNSLFLDLLKRIRQLILNGLGAAGALSWAGHLVLQIFERIHFDPLYAFTVPVLACIIGVLTYFGYLGNESKGFIFECRKFLLEVCGAAGATYFILTWIALCYSAATIGTGGLFLASFIVALLAAYAVYGGDKQPGLAHNFLTKVFGAGGGSYWLLDFLIWASVGVNPILLIIIPAVMMAISGAFWCYEKSDEIKQTRLSVYSYGKVFSDDKRDESISPASKSNHKGMASSV